MIMQVSKKLLEEVKNGLELLIDQNNQLREDRLKLENHIEELQIQLVEANNKLAGLQEENGQLKMARAVSGDGNDGSEAKSRINEMVREIDKCLALLNT